MFKIFIQSQTGGHELATGQQTGLVQHQFEGRGAAKEDCCRRVCDEGIFEGGRPHQRWSADCSFNSI